MRLYLIRHGESEGNVDRSVYLTKPDHAIQLSDLGKAQAIAAGQVLGGRLAQNNLGRPCRVWASPYTRTRQTLEGILEGAKGFPVNMKDQHESIHIVEQQYGLFDGIPDEDLSTVFPAEYAHYKKCEDFEGKFWARMPLGESRFDVCQRVHQFLGTIRRDRDVHGIEDVVIVSHGVTLRALTMMMCHYKWEWFEAERNPKNCSIRYIRGGLDEGYVYEGTTSEPSKADCI